MYEAQATVVQFIPDGDLALRHLPTGNRYSTYPASHPEEFYVLCTRGLAANGTKGDELRYLVDLREAARPMLEQMLRRRRSLAVVPKRQ